MEQIITALNNLETSITQKLSAISLKVDAIGQKFDTIDRQFDAIDGNLQSITSTLDTHANILHRHGLGIKVMQSQLDSIDFGISRLLSGQVSTSTRIGDLERHTNSINRTLLELQAENPTIEFRLNQIEARLTSLENS
jgi:chromosome segregation ATPase